MSTEKYVKVSINEPLILEPEDHTEEEWGKAIEYLNALIVEYASIGWAGRFGLDGVLIPLKKRYDSGERSKALYDAIMECE